MLQVRKALKVLGAPTCAEYVQGTPWIRGDSAQMDSPFLRR